MLAALRRSGPCPGASEAYARDGWYPRRRALHVDGKQMLNRRPQQVPVHGRRARVPTQGRHPEPAPSDRHDRADRDLHPGVPLAGIAAISGGRLCGLQLRLHPGGAVRRRRAAGGSCGAAGGGDALHLDVPAWRPDASGRQHALPLGVRQQYRGQSRPRPVPDLLPVVRHRRRLRPGAARSDLRDSDDRRERRDLGGARRLSDPLPACPGARDHPVRLPVPAHHPGGLAARFLVHLPAAERPARRLPTGAGSPFGRMSAASSPVWR